ncbi:hypothetical protein ACFQ1M_02950 [Sungkyunkwania multivorans]|uniref:Uncharacterized protein n=1 Tax=Sungkyunkwania multivorans TaxID=1173618 RepID=A0ABW3CX13_9FLAO
MFQELLEEIRITDKMLTESREKNYSENIDINQDNWLEIAQERSEAFRKEHSKTLDEVTKSILTNFDHLDTKEKKLLIETIGGTDNLKDMLRLTEEYDTIENKILLLIISNVSADIRDTMLELNDIVDLAAKNKIAYKKIIKKYLPIADDTNKHGGMGSMKSYLTRMVE